MKISEVCTRTGLTDRTVRFYIEKGLLKKDAENINGRNCRDYDEEDIQALNRISALRKAGFSIQDILDMQHGPEVVWDIIFRHSKQLEAEAASYTAIAKELKSIHIGGGISWQKLADVLAEDGNGNLKPITEDVSYISVSIRLDVPYGVANAFGAVEVDAHTGWPILQAEEVLEHKELLESYCTVTKVDYGN